MKYISQVEYDDLSGEYILPLPEELLDAMGWVEGDMLRWEIDEDETLILRKTND
jgi:bifunctional DNA-binding transcriptional regulator/antitoxin component of YhaV-PrlF toxin-antitoxin module